MRSAASKEKQTGRRSVKRRKLSAIGTILVPTDFSEGSRYALDFALDLGRALGARVEVLHVVNADSSFAIGMTTRLQELRNVLTQMGHEQLEEN